MDDPSALELDTRLRQLIDHLPDAVLMFDTDLRLVLAGGRPLTEHGYEPRAIIGRTLSEILPPEAYDHLIGPYRSALSGEACEFEFTSEIVGGRFHVRIAPLRDNGGAVVGAMSVTTDVASREGLEFELDNARHLLSIGTAVYERRSGWAIDSGLLEMWGLSDITEPADVVTRVVVSEDRDTVVASWERLAASGGRTETDYRIVHGRTGEIRDMHGTTDVLLGADGSILRAITTQIDTTDMNRSRAEAERVRQESDRFRENLVQQALDVFTGRDESLEDSLRTTAEFAARAVGEGCAVRVLGVDGRSVERYCIAHQNPERKREWQEWQELELSMSVALPEFIQQALATGQTVSGGAHPLAPGEPEWFNEVRYMAAPIRLGGQVLGVMTIARASTDREFDSVEERLVQGMADRLGIVIDADRTRVRAEQEGSIRHEIGERLNSALADQRDLVLQLDRTESRERMQLAEAVHDQPLQLVVAAMLRLDNLRDRLPEAEGILVDEAAGNLESAVEQLRAVIVTLTPPDLSSGLGPALRSLAESTFIGTSTRVKVTGPDHVRLDPGTKVSVFRILREALINSRKHAYAAHVTIDIVETSSTVSVRLADDGVGMSGAVAGPGHLGLASMRARAEAAHASLQITSPPTGGTVVELMLPARSAAESEQDAAADRGRRTEEPRTMERRLT